MDKLCTKCKLVKQLTEFSPKKDRAGTASWCKECKATDTRERHRGNPKKTAEVNRRQALKRYGLTPKDYQKLLRSQDSTCAVCDAKYHIKSKKQNLAVDHCHTTGKVRGLLCNRCNYALGLVEDDRGLLLNLINYLNRAENSQEA